MARTYGFSWTFGRMKDGAKRMIEIKNVKTRWFRESKGMFFHESDIRKSRIFTYQAPSPQSHWSKVP